MWRAAKTKPCELKARFRKVLELKNGRQPAKPTRKALLRKDEAFKDTKRPLRRTRLSKERVAKKSSNSPFSPKGKCFPHVSFFTFITFLANQTSKRMIMRKKEVAKKIKPKED